MTIAEAIDTIIKKYGVAIFDSPERVQSMIMDYAGGREPEKKLFFFACQKGLLRFAQIIIHLKEESAIQAVALSAKNMLQNDAYMSEEHAIHSINLLLNGFGYTFKMVDHIHKEEECAEEKVAVTMDKQCSYTEYRVYLSDDKGIEIEGRLIEDLRKSAQKGNVSALLSLGNSFFYGIGVDIDWKIAEYYYRKARKLGNRDEKREARNRLNEIYNSQQTSLY